MQCEAMIIDIQQVSQQLPWRKCQSIHQFRHPPGFQLLLQKCFLGEFFCMTASWHMSPPVIRFEASPNPRSTQK